MGLFKLPNQRPRIWRKAMSLKGLKIRLSAHSFILCHFYLHCQAANPPLSQTKGTVPQSLRGLWESLGMGSDLGGYSREMLDKNINMFDPS